MGARSKGQGMRFPPAQATEFFALCWKLLYLSAHGCRFPVARQTHRVIRRAAVGRNFYPHAHPIPIPMWIPMGIPNSPYPRQTWLFVTSMCTRALVVMSPIVRWSSCLPGRTQLNYSEMKHERRLRFLRVLMIDTVCSVTALHAHRLLLTVAIITTITYIIKFSVNT